MTTSAIDSIRATADCCGFSGTLAAISLHSCNIQAFGGRCEDYPCCGHTDGLGCQTTPEMTSDFYLRNPELLHEPGSPEWYDAQDRYGDEDECDPETCEHDGYTFNEAERTVKCDYCDTVGAIVVFVRDWFNPDNHGIDDVVVWPKR